MADAASAQCRSCGRQHSGEPKEAMVWPLEHEGMVAGDDEAQAYFQSKKIQNTPQYHYTGAPEEYYVGRSYKSFPSYNNWFTPFTQKRIDYRKRCLPWRPW